jgi:hypothetical protein
LATDAPTIIVERSIRKCYMLKIYALDSDGNINHDE